MEYEYSSQITQINAKIESNQKELEEVQRAQDEANKRLKSEEKERFDLEIQEGLRTGKITEEDAEMMKKLNDEISKI